MTLAERIIANHAGSAEVAPGWLVTVNVDRIYVQDGNTPTVRRLFAEYGFRAVFDPERIGIFFDHSVLSPEVAMTNRLREAEEFAASLGFRVFRAGSGISHVVAAEEGWFQPGTVVLGADSHTCTGGAVQCLALGMGASDVVAAMVTGRTWLRVPQTVWLELVGRPGPAAGAKDVMLAALARFGQQPFLYRSVEWHGEWIEGASEDSAATIANMTVEMGAKCAFLPPRPARPDLAPIRPPPGDDSPQLRLDIDGLPPFVAAPHSPLGGRPIDECAGQAIDYVFVGSCANSRIEDLAEVARILDGAQVHPRVHCVVTPGSQRVFLDAIRLGLVERMIRAGALVVPPGCGACVGTQGTIPAADDRVLSTMNRNFQGRMGSPQAQIWLASPRVAAYTALLGRIPRASDLQ